MENDSKPIDKCILCDTKCSVTNSSDTQAHFSCINCGDYNVEVAEIILLSANKDFMQQRHLLSGLSSIILLENILL